MVLEGLHHIEVRSLTFRETILSIELEFGSDNGVLSPAVHVQSCLGKNECSGIRHKGSGGGSLGLEVGIGGIAPLSNILTVVVIGSGILKETSRDEGIGSRCLRGSSEGVDSVGKSIDGICVVEGLGTKCLEEGLSSL